MSEQSATTQDTRTDEAAAASHEAPVAVTEDTHDTSTAGTDETADTTDSAAVGEVADQAAAAGSEAAQPAESPESSEPDASPESSDSAASSETPGSSKVARLEREGEVAADFLEQLLDIADLDGDLDVDVDGDRAAVAIVDSEEGRVPRRLVGDHAKVLEALQELTRLAVQAATGERSRLMLDVAGYRADRRQELVKAAGIAIEEVKSSGERQGLEPMTAFERKVVHDEVLAAGLSSESEGVEPRRYVVILPD